MLRYRIVTAAVRLCPMLVLLARTASAQTPAPVGAPLLVESTGREQSVELVPVGAIAALGTFECRTPCRVRVPAGDYRLVTYGRGVRRSINEIAVPDAGLRVRVRAASKSAYVWGWILTTFGGAATLIYGGFGAAALLSAPGDAYNQMLAGIMAGAVVLVAAPCLAIGILLFEGSTAGIERRSPGAVSVAISPLAGGGIVHGSLRF